MAVNPSIQCAPQLGRSLSPRSPIAFFNRVSSRPAFLNEAPSSRIVLVRSQMPSSDGLGHTRSVVESDSHVESLGASALSAIDFLTLCHRLKTTKRKGWINHGIKGPESIADHMYRMALMALIAGDLPGVNRERCIKAPGQHFQSDQAAR